MHTHLCFVAAAAVVCFVIPATLHLFINVRCLWIATLSSTLTTLTLASASSCFFLYNLDLPTDCSLWLLNPCSLLATGLGIKIFETYELCVTKKDLLNMPRDLRHMAGQAICALRKHPPVVTYTALVPCPDPQPFRDTAPVQSIHHHCRCRSAAA